MPRPAAPSILVRRLAARVHLSGPAAGMTTAEYAVGTVAACGFAGLLYKVITSAEIIGLLREVISSALHVSF